MRTLTSELLRSAGHKVLDARNGDAAIEITKEHCGSIDLVLTDVIMPGMSGGDLVVYLRRLRPELSTLFMSGYASDLISRAGVPDSERFVLQKPFSRKSLLTKVRSVLDGAAAKS